MGQQISKMIENIKIFSKEHICTIKRSESHDEFVNTLNDVFIQNNEQNSK